MSPSSKVVSRPDGSPSLRSSEEGSREDERSFGGSFSFDESESGLFLLRKAKGDETIAREEVRTRRWREKREREVEGERVLSILTNMSPLRLWL